MSIWHENVHCVNGYNKLSFSAHKITSNRWRIGNVSLQHQTKIHRNWHQTEIRRLWNGMHLTEGDAIEIDLLRVIITNPADFDHSSLNTHTEGTNMHFIYWVTDGKIVPLKICTKNDPMQDSYRIINYLIFFIESWARLDTCGGFKRSYNMYY